MSVSEESKTEPAVVLELKNLQTHFFTDMGVARSVDGVSYKVREGQTLGVVGESGCGKSVTALSIMGLIPRPPGKIVGGQILFDGKDLTKFSEEELRKIRGKDIAMIFQEPMTSLNPVYTVGDQIMEMILNHEDVTEQEARERAIQLLAEVGIPSPEERVDNYPHNMSGGMRQRVMIAMSLACSPRLLLADEPTTALDVTIQAQILDLMNKLQKERNTAIVMITHDLGVVAETCDHVVVMYAGHVAENADVYSLFENPCHPYTIALFKSIPDLVGGGGRLFTIDGMVPSAYNFPEGCRFRDRCPFATEQCLTKPEMEEVGPDHFVACHNWREAKAFYAKEDAKNLETEGAE
jgi:peptide/nickel transport system ATP-binding protein/oligopeptide transport system ATP-binding protein